MKLVLFALFALFLSALSKHHHHQKKHRSEFKRSSSRSQKIESALPHTYVDELDIPESFSWGNVGGTNYLTKMLNQHLPQYCGSCWAHGAISALGDRIKIARGAKASGPEFDLAVQYILNCGQSAGSCYGGDHHAAYEFMQSSGHVPFDSCNPYLACSSDSSEGFCSNADWTCTAPNICRTCSTFSADGGKCVGLQYYPNATVAQYGSVSGEAAMMAEIYARGPIACGIDAQPLTTYTGGIANFPGQSGVDHVISVVGWGVDNTTNTKYWIVRNSWGQYWGEMGYFRLTKGQLDIESDCAWAVPGAFTETLSHPCYEDGSNCVASSGKTGYYVDPSVDKIPLGAKLSFDN